MTRLDKTRQDRFQRGVRISSGKAKKKYQGVAYCIDLRLLCSFSLGFHLPMSLFFSISQTDTRLYSFLARQLKVFIEAIHTVRHRKGFHDGKIH